MHKYIVIFLLFLLTSCSGFSEGYNFEEVSEYKGRKYRISAGEFRVPGDPLDPYSPEVEIIPLGNEINYPTLTKEDKIKLQHIAKPYAQKYCKKLYGTSQVSLEKSHTFEKTATFFYSCL